MIRCVLVLVCLLVCSSTSSASPWFVAWLWNEPRAWPCPEAADISPCTCFADDDLDIFLDCQNLHSLQQLKDVFSVPFPFMKFARLQISNSNLGTMTEDVFPAGFMFKEVIMYDNNLGYISKDTFQQSHTELTFIEFSDHTPDFPLPDNLILLPELREAVLSANCSEIPAWESDSLITLTLRCFYDTTTLPTTPLNLSQLTALHLHHTWLEEVPENSFVNSPLLQTLSLNDNQLSDFPNNALSFTALHQLDLSNNQLTNMPIITGMSGGGTVVISGNSGIERFNNDTTKPLIDIGVIIIAENIELTCGCEIQWLLGEDDTTMPLNSLHGVTTVCDDGTGSYDDIREILGQLCTP